MIGVQAFKDEVAQELSGLSGEALHALIQRDNYNSNSWFLAQLVTQAACELATALTIYWACQPTYYYELYQALDADHADLKAGDRERVQMLSQIEHAARQGKFSENLPLPDVTVFLDGRQPDYSVQPFSAIPAVLRVFL